MDEFAHQLPRGRHGLAREEVEASQRARLAIAVIDAVAQNGYHGTTVAHIVRGARVSRETFYEHFASKDACFTAAIESVVGELTELLRGALSEPGEPLDKLNTFVRVLLDWLTAHPTAAHCLLLELRNAGPEMIQRSSGWYAEVVDTLEALFGAGRFECEFFAAGLLRIVTARLETGELDRLPELREPVLRVVRQYHAQPPGVVAPG